MVEIPCANCGTPVDASGGKCPECGFRQMTLPWALQYFARLLLAPVAAAIVYAILSVAFPDLMSSSLVTKLFVLAILGLVAYNVVVVSYRFLRRRKLIREAKADQRNAASDAPGADSSDADGRMSDAGGDSSGTSGPESESTTGDSSDVSVDVDPVLLTNRTQLDLDDGDTVADALAAADLAADVGDVGDDLDLGIDGYDRVDQYETSTQINLNAAAIGLGMDEITDVEGFPGLAYHGEETGDAVIFRTGEVVLFTDPGSDPDALRTAVESTLTERGVVGD